MKPNTQTEQSRNGKGDKPRTNTASKQYQENYAQINWTKHTTGKSESIGHTNHSGARGVEGEPGNINAKSTKENSYL
jgi:hypothetical protein